MAEFTPDQEGAWRCKHQFHRFCPVEGCTKQDGCHRVNMVKGALDNAMANGHSFDGVSDVAIAEDMLAYWAEVEDWPLDELVVFVQEARK